MRISDWSSDVCSSDLAGDGLLFDTADPTMPGDHLVGYDHVANLLGATDETPALVVLNACNTADGIDLILEVAPVRSEERSVGKECVSTGRSWWSTYP